MFFLSVILNDDKIFNYMCNFITSVVFLASRHTLSIKPNDGKQSLLLMRSLISECFWMAY